jgi:hypothetical protein
MLDKKFEPEGRSDRERPIRPADDLASVGDREVPLAPAATDVVNRWLDGEIPEPASVRGEAARSVDFWKKIGEETDRRRHMVTPSHLQERIMAALPPLATTTTPWYQKDLHLTAAHVIAGALALFALGLLVARFV